MARQAHRNRSSHPDQDTPPAGGRAGRLRRLWHFVLLIAAMGAAIWWAPALLARLGLTARVISWAVPALRDQLSIQRASLSWLGPVELHGVSLQDPQRRPLLEVSRVSTQRTLMRLLLDRRGVGRVHVQQPRLTVVTRPNGSNVEDALGTWLSQLPTQPGTDGVELDLELVEGVINVSQTHGMATMTIDDVQMSLKSPSTKSPAFRLNASGRVDDDRQPGSLTAQLSWNGPHGLGSG